MGVWTKSIALVTVLGFVVAGCGSDSDGGGAAATNAPSATGAPSATDAAPGATDAAPADSSGVTTGDSTAAPTGEPIKLMTVTTLNANGP
ncbi:MAG: hypothetical protein JWN99_1753, partial [Ilumatobacteraceae bacterium]|nr:hypothetical protein [Ilumatobacteraceae bacterium]